MSASEPSRELRGPRAALRCPVCKAQLRGARVCGRCSADLTEFLRVTAAAWRARRAGWTALAIGDAREALQLAEHAASLEASASAQRLAWLARVLAVPAR